LIDKSDKVDDTDGNNPQALPDVGSTQLPNQEDLDSLSPLEIASHLQKLLEIQKQLSTQQVQLQQQLKEVRLKMSKAQEVQTAESAKNMETHTPDSLEVVTQISDQQVLRVLELPTSPPTGN
jgi:predicted transcriptional regulator